VCLPACCRLQPLGLPLPLLPTAAALPPALPLQIDIEGFEVQALKGAAGLFARHKIWFLMSECNQPVIGRDGAMKYLRWGALCSRACLPQRPGRALPMAWFSRVLHRSRMAGGRRVVGDGRAS